ncbi:erythromycin esterase family protein [Streptomonospora nanhaiensis]|uniref:Erythromycin esterase n=1 Tax=Streptomonospora nanhaiensis TaxID=1323731 RepID=A0A853BKX6_9ACTN|nr:erythromycin esterase family protein [Streptomonospora nanhaiensis]MBV2365313.1 erythromycin esterase family protein [Streptomonospora nanhaiensis]NYI95883.1 erythromycin esterase [Streptomonospora nanhaiensis]
MTDGTSAFRARHWLAPHTTVLGGLDPDAPLDDLEPLRAVIGDARVVAVGEGAHFVREFGAARRRLVRFLAERCGFTVLAFEYGFAEGLALQRWLDADTGADGPAEAGGTANAGLTPDMGHWLRRHNRTSGHPLRFVGVDVPVAGGRLRPVLEPLADYLREVDPEALPRAEAALALADRFGGESVAAAAPAWARLEAADRDALTAALARLLLRVRALEPVYVERGGADRYATALRLLEAATHTDYMFGAMSDLFAGGGLGFDTSVREHYMARTLLWHLDRAAPGTRFVLAAHNNHIQKTPITGDHTALPMGHLVHRELGADYRAVALTHTADRVPEMYPDDSEAGFSVAEAPLAPPPEGSVEAAIVEAGHGAHAVLADLRGAPEGPADRLVRMRSQSAVMEVPVRTAFDAVLSVPATTTEVSMRLGG